MVKLFRWSLLNVKNAKSENKKKIMCNSFFRVLLNECRNVSFKEKTVVNIIVINDRSNCELNFQL